jgi:hypothetical protein
VAPLMSTLGKAKFVGLDARVSRAKRLGPVPISRVEGHVGLRDRIGPSGSDVWSELLRSST